VKSAITVAAVTVIIASFVVREGQATVFPAGTVVVSNDFENQTSLGAGTDPATFGAVTVSNLPVNRPTSLAQAGTNADACVATNGMGFTSRYGAIYSGTSLSGYQVEMKWDFSALSISSGTHRVAWDASAAQTNKKGGHIFVKRAGSGTNTMLDLWFTSAGKFTATGVSSNFGSYSSNTPVAFTMDLNLNATNFDLSVNGAKFITNGVLQNFAATNQVRQILFQTYSLNNPPTYDGNNSTFGIDNLRMIVPTALRANGSVLGIR
jgi:hypothetical protein